MLYRNYKNLMLLFTLYILKHANIEYCTNHGPYGLINIYTKSYWNIAYVSEYLFSKCIINVKLNKEEKSIVNTVNVTMVRSNLS